MLRGGARRIAAWAPEERDAVLYGLSAVFAIVTARFSSLSLYRQWGELAAGPYLVAALLSIAAHRFTLRRDRATAAPAPAPAPGEGDRHPAPGVHWTLHRSSIFLLVLVGVTLLPLSLEILWRSQDNPAMVHVQDEVVVVERAGLAVAKGHDPYHLLNPHRLPKIAPGAPGYDAFDPYLPLMSYLGIARSTKAPPRLTDARIVFSLLTIVVVAGALVLCRGPSGPRVLSLQVMTVLPTAALPLATGGDDVPVAALLLLGLVLLERRRPLLAGLGFGVAASMKITAWPLAAIAVLAAADRTGRRTWAARGWATVGMAAVMAPAILPTALRNVPAFVQNVVRFPLGLAGISSPAASPLLGHLFIDAFPSLHRPFTITVAAAGLVALGWILVRRTPRRAADATWLVAWAMTVAICLAPATRIGYLLYPADLLAWTWLLRTEARVDEASGPTPEPLGDDQSGPGPVELGRVPVGVGASADVGVGDATYWASETM